MHIHTVPPLPLATQRDIEGGVDYCRRKVLFVKDKLEQLSQLVSARAVAQPQYSCPAVGAWLL